MTWVKFDDRFHAHPKLAKLGTHLLEAVGLHVLATTWSASYETDGLVPEHQVTRLGGSGELAQALVNAGLWELANEDYQIHDFLDYNPSKAELQQRRSSKAEAGRRGGLQTAINRQSTGPATAQHSRNAHRAGDAPDRQSTDELAVARQARRTSGTVRPGKQARTPVPDSGPVPEPDTGTHSTKRVGGQRAGRPDVVALHTRQGYVSPAQKGTLDEIAARHDLTGPSWAADIIAASPPDADPFADLMAADRRWQAERRREADANETRWEHEKLADRSAAANLVAQLEQRSRDERLGGTQ